MSKKKRKKPLPPRVKRMDRQGRLQSARATKWVESYTGGHIVRSYRRKYGVDLLSAIIELRALGVSIPASYEAAVRTTIEETSRKRREAKEAMQQLELLTTAPDQPIAPFPWPDHGTWDDDEMEIPF